MGSRLRARIAVTHSIGAGSHRSVLLTLAVAFAGVLVAPVRSQAQAPFPERPDWVLWGTHDYAIIGISLAGLGDVDGDGYPDVAAAEPGRGDTAVENDDPGSIYVFRGGPTGLNTCSFGRMEGSFPGAHLGFALVGPGDVNGDGLADIAVGAKRASSLDPYRGRAEVYLGRPRGISPTPDWAVEGDGPESYFGMVRGPVGDLTADGRAELVVSAIEGDVFAAGRLSLFAGASDGLSAEPFWEYSGEQEREWLGFSPSSVAVVDVDGDTVPDLVVGAQNFDDEFFNQGRVLGFLGEPFGVSAEPAWEMRGDGPWRLGQVVVGVGDVDGDGWDDLFLGQPTYTGSEWDEGRARILGGPVGTSPGTIWQRTGGGESAFLGGGAGLGDVNGDGLSDFVVSSSGWRETGWRQGKVELFLGREGGPEAEPSWTRVGASEGARYGERRVGVGDLDGDGLDDLMVAAPFDSTRYVEGGLVEVFLACPPPGWGRGTPCDERPAEPVEASVDCVDPGAPPPEPGPPPLEEETDLAGCAGCSAASTDAANVAGWTGGCLILIVRRVRRQRVDDSNGTVSQYP